jgi:hypothetical protein
VAGSFRTKSASGVQQVPAGRLASRVRQNRKGPGGSAGGEKGHLYSIDFIRYSGCLTCGVDSYPIVKPAIPIVKPAIWYSIDFIRYSVLQYLPLAVETHKRKLAVERRLVGGRSGGRSAHCMPMRAASGTGRGRQATPSGGSMLPAAFGT